MTPDERKVSGSDHSRLNRQPREDSNRQGGEMSKYSNEKKVEFFQDDP